MMAWYRHRIIVMLKVTLVMPSVLLSGPDTGKIGDTLINRAIPESYRIKKRSKLGLAPPNQLSSGMHNGK